MNTEKKDKITALRKRLANLTEAEKEVFKAKGILITVEGRSLSFTNTILCYLQSFGTAPTIVGGYQQWRKAGRQVRKGEHSLSIWFPTGKKDKDGNLEDQEDIRFFMGSVFDISQTDPVQIQTPTEVVALG